MVWCCDADEVVWRFWGAADVEGISVGAGPWRVIVARVVSGARGLLLATFYVVSVNIWPLGGGLTNFGCC
jgi:hypothetical protein